MDDGFALRFDGNQQVDVVRHAITQDDHAAAACGRPLSKQDMQEILQIDALEFDLFVSLEILKPSLFLEYAEGQYLGFFSFWDCLNAEIYRELAKVTRDTVISDEVASTIVQAALGEGESFSLDDLLNAKRLRNLLQELFDDLGLDHLHDQALLDRLSESLIQAIKRMHANLERTVFGEDPVHFSPFTVHQCSAHE